MKVTSFVIVLILIACLAGPVWAKGGKGVGNRGSGGGSTAVLTSEEAKMLTFLFEEEKLARDAYHYFADYYGAVIFSNIAASEQRHMDAVGRLLTKYNLEVPEPFDGLCVYSNEVLTAECDRLISQGATLQGALMSGVEIEEMDIQDIEIMLVEFMQDETIKTDTIRVLGNLLDGSNNHLNAFTQSLELLDLLEAQ